MKDVIDKMEEYKVKMDILNIVRDYINPINSIKLLKKLEKELREWN